MSRPLVPSSSPPFSPPSLGWFFGRALGFFILSTLLWMQVSSWTSYPAGLLAHAVLHNGSRYWVREVHQTLGQLEVETRITVEVSAQLKKQGGVAELVAQADPAHYAYGLPLLLALLLASRSPHLLKRLLTGYALLLVPQTFSLVMDILRQIMVAGAHSGGLAVDPWQLELIALGYQVGALLLPALAPVGVWLWFEQAFWQPLVLEQGQRLVDKASKTC